MMMNQGGVTDTITTLDPNSLENRQAVDPSQAYTSSYYASSTGSTASPWTMPRTDNCSTDSGVFSNSNYHHYQAADPSARNAQDGLSVASIPSTSVSGPANVQQDSGSYATYPNTDPYGYGNTGYTGYYSGYQQQSKQSYPQPVGAYQSTDIRRRHKWRLQ